MPRRRRTVTKPIPTPDIIKRRKPKIPFAVTFMTREARPMFTARVGDKINPAGALIRVDPADNTSDEVQSFTLFLSKCGAVMVKTISGGGTAQPLQNTPAQALTDVSTPREAVEAILTQENDPALSAACEEHLSEVGL